jgi:very-short-patch-repair endonuclease
VAESPHHQSVKPRQRGHARTMRRIATDAERKLWFLLRDRRLSGIKFRRQVPFGPYILDFVCFEHRLVIEVDGGQHADSAGDKTRDAKLKSEGFQIVRYWNNDVLKNPEGVLMDVLVRLEVK